MKAAARREFISVVEQSVREDASGKELKALDKVAFEYGAGHSSPF